MKKYVAEFIGTFVLTFFGCGTAIVAQCSTENYAGYLITALAFGLSIVAMAYSIGNISVAMAYSIGNISGCHINPAVSLAMLIRKKMTASDFVGYVIGQCAGGLAAGAALLAIFGKDSGLGTNGLYNGSIPLSILIEVILTCVFLLAVIGATSKPEYSNVAGIVIGLSLVFVHILGIGLTGTSVNPARSLVAVFAGGEALGCLWVFIAAPLIGAAVAAVVYSALENN